MKNKFLVFLLLIIILGSVIFMILFNNYLNNILISSKKIDADIYFIKNEIDKNNEKLINIKEKNNIQSKSISNMDNYIDSLDRRLKEFEG